MQLGNAADRYDEQQRGRGWSLSVSRNDITQIALIYFSLDMMGFAPQALSAAVVAAPWDAEAQCTSI